MSKYFEIIDPRSSSSVKIGKLKPEFEEHASKAGFKVKGKSGWYYVKETETILNLMISKK